MPRSKRTIKRRKSLRRKNQRLISENEKLYTEYKEIIKNITTYRLIKEKKDLSAEDSKMIDEKLVRLRKIEKDLADIIIFNDNGIYRGRI